jgi:hypothetical protein
VAGTPIQHSSGAHLTAGGVWTDASSRDYKEHIVPLTTEEALQALSGLKPVKFNYKVDAEEKYVGFIAEDVPALVARKDRKSLSPMDIVAVLTQVVQEQRSVLAEKSRALEEQKIDATRMKEQLSQLASEVGRLQKLVEETRRTP